MKYSLLAGFFSLGLGTAFCEEPSLTHGDAAQVVKALEGTVPSISKNEVHAFITAIADMDMDDLVVCSFALARLGSPETTILVESDGFSSRTFCRVHVYGMSGGKIWQSNLPSADIWDVTGDIYRPAGANRPYLVIPEEISEYEGFHCIATVPIVYDVTKNGVVDVRGQFRAFYKYAASFPDQVLGADTEESLDPAGFADRKLCRQMAIFKMQRLAGLSKDAGLKAATEWMKSADGRTRRKAIYLFADIHDSESVQKLRLLSRDKDSYIAMLAREALEGSKLDGGLSTEIVPTP